ncbi:regulator of G-protein signaling 21 [Xyrichtys novacula]|uniref:Regulator of G-protein signaling 21 n=1 Tax=Xyrichtys novacula TaxID=13765 RepID=A0AAV1FJ95_XYRNO|nr:regulator of G-protein signaling 21 [Xyrichtys novacula]
MPTGHQQETSPQCDDRMTHSFIFTSRGCHLSRGILADVKRFGLGVMNECHWWLSEWKWPIFGGVEILIQDPFFSFLIRIDIVLNRKRHKKDIQRLMVQKLNEEAYSSKRSWQADHELFPTMEKLLQDKKCLAAFRAFLKSEFSEENLDFWLACEDFRSTASSDDLRWKAEKIYQEFIEPTACREVSLHEKVSGQQWRRILII